MPTKEQIDAGNTVCAAMLDATLFKALGGQKPNIPASMQDIINLYLDGVIDSVTGIYIAMQRAA